MAVLTYLSRWLLVLTLTFSIGAHWIFLQSIAWVGMMVNYSHNASFTEAVRKTFDGQHQCKLCRFVQEGKQTEKKQDVLKVTDTKEFCFQSKNCTPCPPSAFTLLFATPDFAQVRTEAPPVPPPRGLPI